MAFQFVHLECWSRKADDKGRSTDFIFDEADRKPIASVHVREPSPPTVIYGVGVEEVRQMHDAAAAAAMTPGAKGKLRKISSAQKTLHTVVASHPYTVDEVRADRAKAAEVRDWEKRTIAWLRQQYGPALKSVVRHTDEKQWHVHAYVLPTSDKELRAAVFHPGIVAKRAVMAEGRRPGEDGKALNKRSNAAYQSALRQWQDSYHEAVGVPCGLTRLGPQRRRLTRAEWLAEQAQAKALKNAVERAAVVRRDGQAYIDRTRAAAAAMRADAAKVHAQAEKFQGVGGAVRAAFDGIHESRIRSQIRREFARDLAAATKSAEKAKAAAAAAKAEAKAAEKKASETRYEMRQQSQRLASANAQIQSLSAALAAATEPERAPSPGGPTPW
ncbi:hypothetical protein GCM10011491_34880 [Brucella endophytica]|uniref:Mob protein n=1 Tax=Brucella endophytica TaxID=1963359 RepID=A0A916WJM8_9HYPH|nr:hypothetical protein [Brucella endophytica]GGB03768.1 hypothetical protein GCM10011491_34880 [Brucella endophytica]